MKDQQLINSALSSADSSERILEACLQMEKPSHKLSCSPITTCYPVYSNSSRGIVPAGLLAGQQISFSSEVFESQFPSSPRTMQGCGHFISAQTHTVTGFLHQRLRARSDPENGGEKSHLTLKESSAFVHGANTCFH